MDTNKKKSVETTGELIKRLNEEHVKNFPDIPLMSEEKVQRLLSQATATFIRYKKPESEIKEERKEKK